MKTIINFLKRFFTFERKTSEWTEFTMEEIE